MAKRIYPRIPLELPVTVHHAARDLQCLTLDINRSGLFVRTDSPKPLRYLVQVGIQLPTDGAKLDVLAVVVRVVTSEEALATGQLPGMGLRLYNLRPKDQRTWEKFVDRAAAAHEAALPEPAWAQPSGAIDSIRRRHARHVATFEVVVRDLEGLYRMLSVDISVGGVFLQAEPLLKLNNPVQLVVVHPLNGEEFPLEGKVVRVVEKPQDKRGIGVQFVNLSPELSERFNHFIESGISMLVSDDVLIDLDDPLLYG